MTITTVNKVRELLTTTRDELRVRREARAAYRKLEQELACYRTQREVDDLLGSISSQEGPEAEQIREVLLDNLRPVREMYRVV
jgi:hypothetical protein